MKVIAALLLALATPAFADDSYAPAEDLCSRGDPPAWNQPLKAIVLRALQSPRRDAILAGTVPTHVVAGELWFDLRDIRIGPHELDGRPLLTRICWSGARIEEAHLVDANFAPAVIQGATFQGVDLTGAVFDNNHLEGTDFAGCRLDRASFRQVVINKGTRFIDTSLESAVFDYGRGPAVFIGGNGAGASFADAELAEARFESIKLQGAVFRGADLRRTAWLGSNVDGADFREASFDEARLDFLPESRPRFGRTSFYHTQLANLDVKEVDVAAVRWRDDDYRIREEIEADDLEASSSTGAKENLYRIAESFYRGLAFRYRDLGYSDEYFALRYRAMESRRKLLRLQEKNGSPELLWLEIARLWDSYGTDIQGVVRRYVALILVFAGVYLTSWLARREWFVWSTTAGNVQSDLPTPDKLWRRARTSFGRVGVILRLLVEALVLSFESSLLVAELVVDYRRYISLLRTRDRKLVSKEGWGRLLVGVEASIGFLCGVSLLRRMALLLAG